MEREKGTIFSYDNGIGMIVPEGSTVLTVTVPFNQASALGPELMVPGQVVSYNPLTGKGQTLAYHLQVLDLGIK